MMYESPKQLAEFDKKILQTFEFYKSKIGQGGVIEASDEKKLEFTQKVLVETRFTNDDSFSVINVPPKEDIPVFQKYDPRFTFGLLLKYINDKSNEKELIQPETFNIPVFHWADYVDMTPLEDYIFTTEKKTCQHFDVRTGDSRKNMGENLLDPDDYCIDDGDAMESVLQNPLKQMKYPSHIFESMKQVQKESAQNPALSTGFHIHRWTGRGKTALRPVIARSYLYDFMPVPLTITFLLPEDKFIQFHVKQGQRQKLRDSDLLFEGPINIKDEISRFANKVSTSRKVLPFESHLQHDDFIDKSAGVVRKLGAEANPLNQTDQNYLAGLRYSLREENPPKHFREANIIKEEPNFGFGSNYDWRFFTGIINKTPQLQLANGRLLKAFLKLTNRYGIKSWVSHGSLLGWYWNGLRLPWEPDVSIQLPIRDFHRLTRLFNQSIVVDFGNDLDKETRFGRYFLDSASLLSQRTKGNTNNIIDARFIDIDTGVKIDITALAVSDTLAPSRYYEQSAVGHDTLKSMTPLNRNNMLQLYNCRKEQFIAMNQLDPLRLSMVQGEYGYIPYGFDLIMQNEYNTKGKVSTFTNNYVYLPKLRMWTSALVIVDFLRTNHLDESRLDIYQEGGADMISIDLNDKEYIEFLYYAENVLRDFLNTREVTSLHDVELQRLLKGRSTKGLFVKNGFALLGLASIMNPETSRAPLYMDYFVNETRYYDGYYSFEDQLLRLKHMTREHELNWQAKEEEEKEMEEEKKKAAAAEEERKKEAAAEEKKKKAAAEEERKKAAAAEEERKKAAAEEERKKAAAAQKARAEDIKKEAEEMKEIEQGNNKVDETKKLADEEMKKAEEKLSKP